MSDTAPVVGGYRMVGRVGSGSTASVWKAMDPALSRSVALKQVPQAAAEVLRAEAARLAQLDDPHVVQVYGFIEESGAAYLVEEWIDGATLSEVLAAGGRLSPSQALGVVRGSLLGLAHAHARGVVHGDISASNIIVDLEGTSRLIDFGVGGSTPAYRAPEVAARGPLSPASDVYAAAAVLVHLLTGQARADATPDLGKVHAGLRTVLQTALAPDPASRYPDAAAFLEALEEAGERTYGASWWTTAGLGALVGPAVATLVPVGGGATAAVVGAGVAAEAGRSRASWRILAAAGAALAVVVVGAVTAVALAGGDDEPSGGDSGDAAEPTSETAEPIDPVVDTVPTGAYTYRQVVVRSDDPSLAKVGDTVERIWTFDTECEDAASCGGSLTSTSGSPFDFTWDGKALSLALPESAGSYEAECRDEVTNQFTGPVTVQWRQRPDPIPYAAAGATDPETGLPERLVGEHSYTERIVAYDNILGGPSRPRDCPFGSNGQIKRTVSYQVTITRGADPKVAKAEAKRIAKEKRQKKRR